MKRILMFGNWITSRGPFVLTLLSVIGVFALAATKGLDVSSLLPTLLGLYLGHKASTNISSHFAASKDPNCDTAQVIRDVEGVSSSKDD